MGKPFQSFFYKNTVFSLKIHYISNCCNSSQFYKIFQFSLRDPAGFIESCHKLQCNYSTAESFFRVSAVRLLWIYNNICRRKNQLTAVFRFFIWNLMMVCYDHCHSFFFCHRNFIICCNSIVTGNDHINSICKCLLDQMLVNPVSI